jgi:hypothetical protein
VTFKWKDYLIKGRDTLDVAEFICFSSASCRTASTAETDYPALQATEISSCSAEVEITPICAEFLVADAVLRNRSPAGNFPANTEKKREKLRNAGEKAEAWSSRS